MNRITIDENLCNGKPTIRGIGITVSTIMEFLLAGETREVILENYPMLNNEDISACIEYTLDMIDHPHTIRKTVANA